MTPTHKPTSGKETMSTRSIIPENNGFFIFRSPCLYLTSILPEVKSQVIYKIMAQKLRILDKWPKMDFDLKRH